MRSLRRHILLALALLVSLLTMGLHAQDQKDQEPYPFVPGEVLVRLKPGAGIAPLTQVVPGATIEKTFEIVPNLQLVRLPAGVDVREAIRLYAQRPEVLYAEPNYIHKAVQHQIHFVPDDPQFSNLWGLHNTGQTGGTPDADIDAPEAWDLSTGSTSVVVFVIDTGGDYNHPDLIANRWVNPNETANGQDDDGNGYIDDIYGIDTAYNDSDPMDGDGHGTHVSGTIGARGNNSIGVVGVNWQVQIGQCKFLNDAGSGSTADAIECLQYIRNLKVNANVPVIATNNSWGGGGFSQALYDAIAEHMNQGILFIAAAGNDGTDNDAIPHYPSNYYLPNIIAVAATDHNDDLVVDLPIWASNYGLRTVHVGAPGKNILSTLPNNQYGWGSGTSMATPHVTGLAALLKAHNPSRDWIAIRNLIFAGGDFKSSLDNKTVLERRINAYQSLSCSNSPTFGILRPFTTVGGGSPVTIAVININCATPAGALTVTINPGGTVVNLVDNGVGPDIAANDGIYSGTWTPGDICQIGTYTLDFSNGQSTTVQVGGAQGSYHCTTPSMSWRTITGTNLNLGDDTWGTINPGFAVQFGTSSYSTVYVNANGLVSFTNNTGSQYNNQQLPYESFTTLIASFWDDLYPSGSDNVYWATLGSAPNRELVIEWRNVRAYACRTDPAATVRFQVVFFESSNQVLFNYQDVDFGGACTFADKGASATVGVQVNTSDATQIGFNSAILNNSMAVHWSTVTPCTSTGAIFRIERTTGNACADGSWNSGGADLAEYVLVSEAVEPGDVVELDPHNPRQYRKARSAYSTLVAGVISTRPGMILGARDYSEGRALVALAGRVPVKATTENGPIRPGDLLTSSSKPGYAMRCANAKDCEGALLGKALEALDASEGVILMLVMR